MTSMESVRSLIAEAKSQTLILMQEGTEGHDYTASESWADAMYEAWSLLKRAETFLDQAELL